MEAKEPTPSFQPIKIKPKKEAFLYYNFALFNTLLLMLVLVGALVLMVVSQHSYLEYMLPFWVVIGIISYINYQIRYTKEVYWIYQDRLVARGGNIISNFESELIIKNITHLGMVHPFIEYPLFKTGDLIVESAGTSLAEITFRSIENTGPVREQLIELLKGQGFSLSQKTLQKEAKQNRTGLTVDTIFFSFSLIFTLGLIAFGILSDLKKDKGPWPWEYLIPLMVLAGIAIILMALHFFFTGLSARYFIYTDTVVERSHFLTFREVIVPMENLADVSLNQGLIKRVLSLYDNRISCQGSGKEIVFSNLADGENIRALLGTYIQKTRDHFRTSHQEKIPSEEGKDQEVSEEKEKRKALQTDSVFEKGFEGDFFMEGKRGYFSVYLLIGLALLLLPLLIVMVSLLPPEVLKDVNPYLIMFGVPGGLIFLALIAGIRMYIDIKATRYSLCSQSFVKNFRFLTTQLVEFTTEKVTGILIRQDIPDRIVKTCTVIFDSIGSEDTLVFQHLKMNPDILNKILAKEEIYEKNSLGELKSSFSFGSFLRANPAVVVFLIGLILGALLGGAFSPYVPTVLVGAFFIIFLPLYIFLHFYYKSATLTFFPDFFRYKIGIFTLYSHYVRYEEIKDLIATQYLFTSVGTLQFDYAGEHRSAGGKGKQGPALESNHFSMPYLEEVFTLRKIVDLILTGKIKAGSWEEMLPQLIHFPFKKIYHSKPKISHGMFELSLLLLILDGVSILLLVGLVGGSILSARGSTPFLVGLAIANGLYVYISQLYIKSFDYSIEEDRVMMDWGIFFKAQKSVNFSKVDTIGKDQGFWHKYFKTGLLSINTVGSGMTELSIDRIPDYKRFYELIQKMYKG